MSRRLIFTRSETVPIAHIAPAVVAAFVAAQASIPQLSDRAWVGFALGASQFCK